MYRSLYVFKQERDLRHYGEHHWRVRGQRLRATGSHIGEFSFSDSSDQAHMWNTGCA